MPMLRCPTCRRECRYETTKDLPCFPFCSERCRLVDMGAWIDGKYVVSRALDSEHAEEGDLPGTDDSQAS